MRKIIYCLMCSLLFACADKRAAQTSAQIAVDFSAQDPVRKIEKIVPLETNEEAFYGRFFRVRVADRHIFVQDMQQILVFDLNGKYLSKVKQSGHGPQEYISISNFWPFRDELYVVTSDKQMVLVYSLSGEFLRSVPVDFRPEALAVTDEYMAFKSAYNQAGTLIVTDRDGHKKYEAVDPILAKTTVSIPATFPFTETDGKIYYFPDFSSSVYTVGADTSDVKRIRFDFGPHTLTPQFVGSLTAGTFTEEFQKHDIVNFPSFYPARDWWGMVFSMGNKEYNWYYNTENGKQYIASAEGTIARKPIACSTNDDQFVEAVDATEFLENPSYAPYRAGRTVNENDNAILIFYSIQ